MQFSYMILYFFTKVNVLAAALYLLSRQYTSSATWLRTLLPLTGAWFVSLSVFLVHEAIIYPMFFNPLRHLPSVDSGYEGRLIMEAPRGKTPLKWAIAQPDAGLIHSKGKLGQSILYPMGPEALRDIMSTNCYDFVKPWGLRSYLARVIGWSLITEEGTAHKAQRRTLQPAFNIKHIRALYPIMWRKAGLLCDVLQQEVVEKGHVEITETVSRYALDIIGVAALSREFNALSTGEHPIAKAFSSMLNPQYFMIRYMAMYLSFEPILMKLFPCRANKVLTRDATFLRKQCEEILDAKVATMAEKRAKHTTEKVVEDAKDTQTSAEQNILTSILSRNDVPRTELVDHMLTMIAAGHETSASSISWACHLLTLPENMHYQTLLRDEIRAAFPHRTTAEGVHEADFNASQIALQDSLETLPYLNGICEEVLRLFPPVPGTLRESVRQTTIAGTVVPAGILVVILPYAINRNPRYWGADADKLRPERWIDELPSGGLRANKNGGAESNYCEVTFLHGGHACIGRDFAKAELKLALASMFGRFEMARLDGDTGSKVRITGSVTTKPLGGLKVTVRSIPGW